MRYIILNDDKKPAEQLRDGGHPLSEVKDFENLAVLVPEPFVVLDFDAKSDADRIIRIVEELDLKCLMMKTTRGVHLWFKAPEPMKNSIKTRSAIDLYYDVRSYGKLSYTVVKRDGIWREWLRQLPGDEVMELPIWLRPIRAKGTFKGLTAGGGRNQALFEYILTLQSRGFTKEQVIHTLHIINDHVFSEPLTEQEMDTITRTESFKDAEEFADQLEVAECFDENGSFKHNCFAHLLVGRMSIITVNDNCFVYEDGIYRPAERRIDQETVQLYQRSRKAQRAEVLDYIKILTATDPTTIRRDEYTINLLNGRLDLKTGALRDWTPDIIDFNQLPVTYDPLASCDLLDETLSKVFLGDQQVIDLFDEMVGYMLIKNARYRKGFLFHGGGSNGKSTILNMLKTFVGEPNLSTVELAELGDTFLTAELQDKLVNIGDDIDAKEIVDTGIIKKLFSGESLTVQRKFQQPFRLKSFAKLIFSCNELPRLLDRSEGMYSRLVLVPFGAEFKATDPDYDPFIEDKLTTPQALSHLLNRGLRGLSRLLATNKFTEPESTKIAMTLYRTDNSLTLTWVKEDEVDQPRLASQPTSVLYSEFSDWCVSSGYKHIPTVRTFHRELEKTFNLERKRVRNKETGNKYSFYFQPIEDDLE